MKYLVLLSLLGCVESIEETRKSLESTHDNLIRIVEILDKRLVSRLESQYPHPLPENSYKITSYYGKRTHPILKKVLFHHGIDYAAPFKTPVLSIGYGHVIFSKLVYGYGNTVVVQHYNKRTLYAHLNKFYIKEGDMVFPGDIIGEVGSTGLSTGNHLHFEIQVDGKPVNPLNYLRAF